MAVSDYRSFVDASAKEHGLDPRIVAAQIQIESGGDPYAWNPEPQYRYFWDLRHDRPFRTLDASELASEKPPADFYCIKGDPDQEWWAQQASWGLMQIMGAVLREHGFAAPYLPQALEPDINIEYGCRHLAKQLRASDGDIRVALARYNGGGYKNVAGLPLRNEAYVRKVESAMRFIA